MRVDQGVFFTRPDPKILSQTHASSEYFCFTLVFLFPLAEEQNYPVSSCFVVFLALVEERFLQSFSK